MRISLLRKQCLNERRQMLRDPRRYSSPEQFNPERFVARDGFEPETDPRQMVFGFGRRYALLLPSLHTLH